MRILIASAEPTIAAYIKSNQRRDLSPVHRIGAHSMIEYYFQSAQVARANDRVNLVAIGVRGLERKSEPKGGQTGNFVF